MNIFSGIYGSMLVEVKYAKHAMLNHRRKRVLGANLRYPEVEDKNRRENTY